MQKIKLMNSPEDYERLGVNPETIEVWEDGRRSGNDSPNDWEWWYSDFIFDDGSTAVVQFFTKAGRKIGHAGDFPSINIRIKLADGTELKDNIDFKVSEASFSTDRCDVRMRGNVFEGNLRSYHVRAHSKKGFGIDVTLESTAKPYRPGSAYIQMGNPEHFYTWFCAVPAGKARGTLTCNGETREVRGTGYHDHQWGNTNFLKEWNHWLWARQRFDDYSMLVFDLTAAKQHDFERLPICFIQDSSGILVFESTELASCDVLSTYLDEKESGKIYPKDIDYVFESNGAKATYRLRQKGIIEAGGLKTAPLPMRLLVHAMGIKHSYTRYLGEGELAFESNGKTIAKKSELIYEFMYPGEDFREGQTIPSND